MKNIPVLNSVLSGVVAGGRLPAARTQSHGSERGYSVSVSPDVRSSFIGPPPRSLAQIAGGAFVGTSFSDPIPRKYPIEPSQSIGSSNPGVAEGAYGVASIYDRPANGRYPLTYGKGLYRIRRQAKKARPRIGVSYKKPEGEYGVGSVFARPTNVKFPVNYGSSGPYRVKRQVEAARPRFGVSYKKPEGEYGVASVFDRPTNGRYAVTYGRELYRVRRQAQLTRPRIAYSYKKPEGQYGVSSVYSRPPNGAFPVTYGTGLYRTKREAAEPSRETTGGAKFAVSFKKPEGEYGVGSIHERPPPANYPTVDGDVYDIKHFKKNPQADWLKEPSNERKEPYDDRTHLITVPVERSQERYGAGTVFSSSSSHRRPLEIHSEVSMDLEEALRISSSDESPVIVAPDEESPAAPRRRPFTIVKATGAFGRRRPLVKRVVFRKAINEDADEEASPRPVLRIPDSIVLPGDRPHHHQDPQHLQPVPPLIRHVTVSTAPIEYAPAFPFGTSDVQPGGTPQTPQETVPVHNPNNQHGSAHHSSLGDKKHLKHATPTRPPTTELVPVHTSKFVFNRNFASRIPAGRFKTPSGAQSPYAASAGQDNPVQAPALPVQQARPPASPSLPPAVPTAVLAPVQPTYANYLQAPVTYTPYAPIQHSSYPVLEQPQHPAYSTVGYSAPYPEFLVNTYGQDNINVAEPQTALAGDIYGIDTGTAAGFKS